MKYRERIAQLFPMLLRSITLVCTIGFVLLAAKLTGVTEFGKYALCIAATVPLVILVHGNQNNSLVRILSTAKSDSFEGRIVAAVSIVRLLLSIPVTLCATQVLSLLDINLSIGGVCGLWGVIVARSIQLGWIAQRRGDAKTQNLVLFCYESFPLLALILFANPQCGYESVLQLHGTALLVALIATSGLVLIRTRLWNVSGIFRADVLQYSHKNFTMLIWGFSVYAYVTADQLLIGMLASKEDVGIYRTAVQLANVLAAFAVLVPQGHYAKYIAILERNGKKALWGYQCVLLRKVCNILVPCTIAYGLLAPIAYKKLLGDGFDGGEWQVAILVASKACVIANGVFTYGLLAHSCERILLMWLSIVGAASILLNICLVPEFGGYGAAWVNLLSEGVVLAMVALLSWRKGKD